MGIHNWAYRGGVFYFFWICTNAVGQIYTSPLSGDLGVHDPVIIKDENIYHIFHTGRLVSHKTSGDRLNWRNAGSVFSSNVSWVQQAVPENNGSDYWAPDISYRDGKFWLYYSVSSFGKQVSAIGLATTESLNSPNWTEEGIALQSRVGDPYNAIDPNIIEDAEGKVWMSWGSFWQGLYIIELNPETGKPMEEAETIHIAGRGGSSIEAPFIYRANGYYYLFVSWGSCCNGISSTYNIRVGRCESVTGPYVDREGMDLLEKGSADAGGTLIDDGDSRWIGPGHNAVFADNDTTFLVNHAYDANANGRSILMIRPLYWTEDNWPTLNSEEGRVITSVQNRDAKPATQLDVFNWGPFLIDKGIFYNLKGQALSR